MAQAQSDTPDNPDVTNLIDTVSAETFDRWYREREYRRNIEQGTPFFNGPSQPQPPTRHSPSRLTKCHRQTYYNQYNAPEETADPNGIFWVGSRIEEDIIVPYLRDTVAAEGFYVTNSIWIDFSVATQAGELRIKGETDPVIVSGDYEPILLTEAKSKDSLEYTDEPNRHHRAQVHAYMKGLSERYDQNVTEALILYVSRKTFDLISFRVEFDPFFWRDTVVAWAEANTMYRLNDELPPPTPEQSWECKFCAYKERCGEGDTDNKDLDPTGLLPGFAQYPREKVVAYLQAHDKEKLTPTLAHQYPDLAERFGVYPWQCDECGLTFDWNHVDLDPQSNSPPLCPSCLENHRETPLSSSATNSQLDPSDHQ